MLIPFDKGHGSTNPPICHGCSILVVGTKLSIRDTKASVVQPINTFCPVPDFNGLQTKGHCATWKTSLFLVVSLFLEFHSILPANSLHR
jgi:hypothetical protein